MGFAGPRQAGLNISKRPAAPPSHCTTLDEQPLLRPEKRRLVRDAVGGSVTAA